MFDTAEHTDSNGDEVCDICGWICGAFEGASVTITDSIAVNYLINKSVVDTLGYSDLYFVFNFYGKEYTVSDYTDDGTYYIFTLDKIAPQLMSEIISAKLYATKDDAAYSSKVGEYSIKRYCHNLLEAYADGENDELCTLLVDMLNYGAKAQVYTDYNVDNLANSDLSDEQKAYGTDGKAITVSDKNLKYTVIDNPTVKWKSAGLFLDGQATLRLTVQAENINGLTLKAQVGSKTIEVPYEHFEKRTDDSYYVYVRGVNVSQMSDEVYLTVYNDENAVSNTICYSIETYANSKIDGDDAVLSDLLTLMIKYGNSAKAYAYSDCEHSLGEGVVKLEAELFNAGINEYACQKCAYNCKKSVPVEKIKILSIGNSFSRNSMNQLYAMCEAAGVKEIDIAIMYYQGRSLNDHYTYRETEECDLYRISNATGGEWTETASYSIAKLFGEETDWDIISLQNGTGDAARESGYSSLGDMTDYVTTACPSAELVWFMTWSFSDDSTYLSGFKSDSRYMHQCIVDCVYTYVTANESYHSVVPVGTAIMNARASDAIGDMVHPANDSHLTEDLGYYVAAYAWVGHITGMSPYDIDFEPSHTAAQENLDTILECAQNALDNPNEIARQSKYTYSFAVVGDTQYLVENDVNWGVTNTATLYDWIVANKYEKNIKAVFGMGDIVDESNKSEQWEWAKTNISKLDGVLPYYLLRGNHDYTSHFNEYFNNSAYTSQFTDEDIADQSGCFYQDGKIDNAYTKLTVGKTKYLVMLLDYLPTDEALEWANSVVAANPDYKVIVTTHDYLAADGSWSTEKSSDDANVGIDIWQDFVSRHQNIFLVLCGHENGNTNGKILKLESTGVNGNKVTQLMINPQTLEWDNNNTTDDDNDAQYGMVAMLYFTEDGSEVAVEYISTVISKEKGYDYSYRLYENNFTFNP